MSNHYHKHVLATTIPQALQRTGPNLSLKLLLFGLALLMIARLALQLLLYRAGFISLTADEFGRTMAAASWALSPYLALRGTWLPFQMYLIGTLLRVWWDLLTVPRLVTTFFGLASILLSYLLAWQLFKNPLTAWVSAILATFSHLAVWLSATPLTEMPFTALIQAGLLFFIRFLQGKKPADLYWCTIWLFLAGGFRLEAWVIAAILSIFLAVRWLKLLYRAIKDRQPAQKTEALRWFFHFALAGCFLWIFPLFWIANDYHITGAPLRFAQEISSWKASHYGLAQDYRSYLSALFQIDAAAVLLVPITWIVFTWTGLRSRPVDLPLLAYILLTAGSFAGYMLLNQGRIENPGNQLRYLAPFVFFSYPLIAALSVHLLGLIGKPLLRDILLAASLLVFVLLQVRATFAISNDLAAPGLAVGKYLRTLRDSQPSLQGRPVLLELIRWQFLAVETGANDATHIFYDRPLTYSDPLPPSLLAEQNREQLLACILKKHISFLIIQSPEIKAFVQERLGLAPQAEINGYGFYPIPNGWPDQKPAGAQPCRLEFGAERQSR
jgi:hypothetical protein